ncbi:MAG: hypothetical protein AB7R00_27155 [Kofleriaceae bacterium]
MTRSTALLVISVLAGGCTKNGALMAGTALAGAGTVMTLSADATPCDNCILDRDGSFEVGLERGLGISVALLGLTLIAISGRLPETLEPAPLPAPAPTSAVARLGPPGSAPVEALAPSMVLLHARLENRLLLQASTAARNGQCNAAVATGEQLAVRDSALYAKLLDTDQRYAACVARARLTP